MTEFLRLMFPFSFLSYLCIYIFKLTCESQCIRCPTIILIIEPHALEKKKGGVVGKNGLHDKQSQLHRTILESTYLISLASVTIDGN